MSPGEKDLGVFLEGKINKLARCTGSPESQHSRLHPNLHDQQVKVIPSSLLCFVRPHLKYCTQLWGLQHKKDTDLLEWVQRRATKMIRGLEHLSCEDRMTELRLFGEEKVLVAVFQYLKGAYMKDGEGLFTRPCGGRTRANGFKLKEGRFRLEIREKFFPIEGSETLEQVAQRSCGYPTPQVFKIC
ncbi:hypothetical protein DUI87_10583 [Hirundo rustica rustica]|uniref:Uncharacterized protein n=1 Tax=Hirundo rustica rustica TaxID=333673 RepID=A0A3M0KJ08_HIRRU|nr:hypothetical protein DUI87_10583 [Hirundo rustica rustica]